MQIIVGLVFIGCSVASVIGALARIEAVRNGWPWDLEDRSNLRMCIVGAVLSGVALFAGVLQDSGQ